jgi:hypothetical protein
VEGLEFRTMTRSCFVEIIVVGCLLLGSTACGGAARGGNGAQPVDAAPSEQNDAMVQNSNDAMVQDSTVAGDAGDSGATPAAAPPSAGAIYTVNRVRSADAGYGLLPDGGLVTITNDGFEFGETRCDATGTTCLTGSLTP